MLQFRQKIDRDTDEPTRAIITMKIRGREFVTAAENAQVLLDEAEAAGKLGVWMPEES